jgi:hypothetical protein
VLCTRKRVLLIRGGFKCVVYLQDNFRPARDKTIDRNTSQIIKG